MYLFVHINKTSPKYEANVKYQKRKRKKNYFRDPSSSLFNSTKKQPNSCKIIKLAQTQRKVGF